ncbi:hypothetical protein CKAH01_11155 [Colletotrichum kahawae]|uniref:Uncharacterized protein n=1 Tax=Colletotrichum kahawae TaxID=34407 RepID=A0AAD9XVV3_COLKA|nr:hypothetical protein CKAH01_11155 [Colletotrichum kahawae]
MSELQPLPPHSEAGLPSSISHSQATPTNPLRSPSDRKGPICKTSNPSKQLPDPALPNAHTTIAAQTRPRRA